MQPTSVRWWVRPGASYGPAVAGTRESLDIFRRRRGTRVVVAVSAALLLVACAGDDGRGEDAAPETTATTRPETTTTAPRTPHEAFLAGLEDSDASFDEGRSPEAALVAAQNACDDLDRAARSYELSGQLETTPGAGDLDQTMGNLGQLSDVAAQSAMLFIQTDFGDETGAIILVLMAEHLCPQHSSTIMAAIRPLGG
jgi:hypothetical protein